MVEAKGVCLVTAVHSNRASSPVFYCLSPYYKHTHSTTILTQGNVTISNDGATILRLLDVVHPAGKALVDVSRAQDAEVCISVFFIHPKLTDEIGRRWNNVSHSSLC